MLASELAVTHITTREWLCAKLLKEIWVKVPDAVVLPQQHWHSIADANAAGSIALLLVPPCTASKLCFLQW